MRYDDVIQEGIKYLGNHKQLVGKPPLGTITMTDVFQYSLDLLAELLGLDKKQFLEEWSKKNLSKEDTNETADL